MIERPPRGSEGRAVGDQLGDDDAHAGVGASDQRISPLTPAAFTARTADLQHRRRVRTLLSAPIVRESGVVTSGGSVMEWIEAIPVVRDHLRVPLYQLIILPRGFDKLEQPRSRLSTVRS